MYQLWSAESVQFLIDTHSTLTVQQQAAHVGKTYGNVVAKRGQLARDGLIEFEKRAYQRPWSPEDDAYLEDYYGTKTMKQLMRHLGRSEVAIIIRKKRKLGLHRSDGMWTARVVGDALGIDSKKVAALVEEGYLHGKRAPYKRGRHMVWMFDARWVEDLVRKYPYLLPDRIERPSYLYQIYREEWDRDPWYDRFAAAAVVDIDEEVLGRRFRSGEVPAHKRGKYWIRRSVLLATFRRKRAKPHEKETPGQGIVQEGAHQSRQKVAAAS